MSVIQITAKKDIARLRRHALAAQGLLQTAPFGRGLAAARRMISHVGYVQIDTISVVERAHHHVFRTRVPNFTPQMTHQLLTDRSIFEYWSHAAAFLPIQDYRFSLPYKYAIKSGKVHWFRTRDNKLMTQLKRRIEQEGPLRSRDVEEGRGNTAGWWDWKPAKRALEQMYMEGDLMVAARDGFQKTYDLPERVLPEGVDQRMPSTEEFAQHLLSQQLRCHHLVSLKGITYYRRNPQLRQAVKALVQQRLDEGVLEYLQLPSGERFACNAGLLDTATPRTNRRMLILSPFDNATIQRDRLKSLFDYDYQIECYVPAEKRRYGYFCLPLLYLDKFVGRVDCKAHRKDKHLEIKALHFNQGEDKDQNTIYRQNEHIGAFAQAITEFAHFQQCETISVTAVSPSHLTQGVIDALNKQF